MYLVSFGGIGFYWVLPVWADDCKREHGSDGWLEVSLAANVRGRQGEGRSRRGFERYPTKISDPAIHQSRLNAFKGLHVVVQSRFIFGTRWSQTLSLSLSLSLSFFRRAGAPPSRLVKLGKTR